MNISDKFKKFLVSSLLLILSFSLPVSAATNYPYPTNYKYVNDYVGILKSNEIETIISLGKELEDKTGAQSIVVIVDTTDDIPIENYAINLFRSWGIGQKNKDNGLLILVVINDRNWRVEVGRGLEGAIPDALSNRVMQSLAKEDFKAENYSSGIIKSYSAFTDLIAKEYGVTLSKSLNISIPKEAQETSHNFAGNILIVIIVISFLLDLFFNRGRVSSSLLQIIFWSNIGRRGGPRGGGDGFGGGGSGGFGGFGGGSSNGGGSSGSW